MSELYKSVEELKIGEKYIVRGYDEEDEVYNVDVEATYIRDFIDFKKLKERVLNESQVILKNYSEEYPQVNFWWDDCINIVMIDKDGMAIGYRTEEEFIEDFNSVEDLDSELYSICANDYTLNEDIE